MEEQRISRMYLNMITRWLDETRSSLFPRGIMRSRAVFLAGLGALVLIPSAGWYLHLHGKFHSAKADLGVTQAPVAPATPRPGGADALVLSMPGMMASAMPEFVSVTMVPGLGMGVLQIHARIPGKGEVALLAAPTLQQLADTPNGLRTGTNDDHGSLELPWAGTLTGQISPLGATLQTPWHSRTLSVSRDPQERTGVAEGGMLLLEAADATQLNAVTDGVVATGEFHSTDFSGHWPSKTNIMVTAQLGPHTLDLTIKAKNVGNDPEPMGLGWMPRFSLPGGDRASMELRLPNGDQMEIDRRNRDLPTGRFIPAGDAFGRFQGRAVPLGSGTIDETLGHLKPALLDSGATAELRDPASGFGLRLISSSPTIRALHLVSPSSGNYVTLGMQTNYDDALGKEWNGDGIATLLPGQTQEWKVRLEIFAISKH